MWQNGSLCRRKGEQKVGNSPLLNNLMSNWGFKALIYEYLITDKRIGE